MILADGNTNDQFGQELILDLYDCDLQKISDAEAIRQFVIKLCDEVIMMKRYGPAVVEHFGHNNPITSGYSLVQLIETSLVSAHFSEAKKSAYINVFSCKWFEAGRDAHFSQKWFGASESRKRVLQRK